MPGASEDAHRAAKVSALAEAFFEESEAALTHRDKAYMKRKRISLEEFISMMALAVEDDLWDELARVHRISKPSERTVQAVKLYLARRATAAAKLPENPLEGLPQ
jgi:hypothetical protein